MMSNLTKTIFITFLLFFSYAAKATHIMGGEMSYKYLGVGADPNSKKYQITLRLFRDDNCVGCAVMPSNVSIGIYDKTNNSLLGGFRTIGIANNISVPINPIPPCTTNPPVLNYSVGIYTFSVDLPNNLSGYTVSYQTYSRIDNMANVSANMGATYTTDIPGNTILLGETDNGADFKLPVSVVCYNKAFSIDFSVIDQDSTDIVTYTLCNAFNGGAAQDANYSTPAPTPYGSVTYIGGYSGTTPLGSAVSINPTTGIVSGTAPGAGKYLISVCATTTRGGRFINTHRKDFILTIAPCDFAGAELKPDYITCDGFTITFNNQNQSPLNQTFMWYFGDGQSSNAVSPTHTYADTGTYTIKLVVNGGSSCADSTTALVKVYPGFFPQFGNNSPVCKAAAVQFTDQTVANYGTVNQWSWNFGDPSTAADTSHLQNPTYTYSTPGTYQATLTVGSSKGCSGTVTHDVVIVDKPPFKISNDTTICIIDTLQLHSQYTGGGTVSWTPNYMISNVNAPNPFVSPDVTTTYIATYTDAAGCIAKDTVTITVVNDVALSLVNDTTICRTDTIALHPTSNALYYQWSPASNISSTTIANPSVWPTANSTVYTLTAGISNKCKKTASITIHTVPYPTVTVSPTQFICYGDSIQITASGGTNYSWTPTSSLNNPNISNPIASPLSTTSYTVAVTSNLGCPKPSYATTIVDVTQVIANAGPSDTSIVINQPLQLIATGGTIYSWSPSTHLSATNIANPIATPTNDITYTVDVSIPAGCNSKDTIRVHVFNLPPDVYVPTAFSPTGDGLNDVLKPIPIGISKLNYFKVYNRYGELVFSTSQIGAGWNGIYKGKPQETGTFVWQAEAINFLNQKIIKSGTAILIR